VLGDVVEVELAAGRLEAEGRLADLFDTHHLRLYRLARRLVSSADEARDIVQDTFLRAARSSRSIPRGSGAEEAWLVRVLTNLCRDRWRRRGTRQRLEAHHQIAAGRMSAPSSEGALIARDIVYTALDTLDPRRRAVIVLFELEGKAIVEIARLLGITPVTVRWHLSRGRKELLTQVKSLNRGKS
jgi:RNA polymerase sigma factor (sigma-70 family)